MSDTPVNVSMLPGNTCFGCGHDNPAGLKIEVFREPVNRERLRGRFTPTERSAGFPNIAHGGSVYTALDCMSTWTATLLRKERGAVWILRSANVTYHSPVPLGRPVNLVGRIVSQRGAWQPVEVRAEARAGDGEILVDGTFKVVPLNVERFKKLAGIDELPAGYEEFLRASASAD
jgi:acyl-coenzyme A thioesterase PaaI-like protein